MVGIPVLCTPKLVLFFSQMQNHAGILRLKKLFLIDFAIILQNQVT